MCFLFFISFSSSVFVPFKKTLLPALQQLNATSFQNLKNDKKILVTLVLPDNIPIEQQTYMLTLFSSIIPIYSSIANFAFFLSRDVPPVLAKVPTAPPIVSIFFDGKLAIACPLPQTEASLAIFIGSWIDPEPKIIQTKEELYQSLASVPLALIVREGRDIFSAYDENNQKDQVSNDIKAIMMLSETFPFIGTCIIVRISDILMIEITINNTDLNGITNFALYRQSDRSIVPLENNKDMSATLYNATKPFYGQLTEMILTRSENVYAAYILPKSQRSQDINDGELFLTYGISSDKKYQQLFRFVVSENNTNRFISQIIRDAVSGPDFIVFSYSDGYYYPNDGSLKNLPITDKKWKEEAEKYLDSIINHKIQKKFFSQTLKDKNDGKKGSGLYKLVGTTYKDFVENPNKDVAILYVDNEDDNEAKGAIDSLSNTIDQIFKGKDDKEIESSTISFGYININENSSPLHYPIISSVPQFMLFPAKNKTDFRLMFSSFEMINFNRFLNKSMTLKPPTSNGEIEYIPYDKMSAQMESFYFSLKHRHLPLQYQKLGQDFVTMLRSVMFNAPPKSDKTTNSDPSHKDERDYDDL